MAANATLSSTPVTREIRYTDLRIGLETISWSVAVENSGPMTAAPVMIDKTVTSVGHTGHQCCFSCPVRTDQPDHFARKEVEINSSEDFMRSARGVERLAQSTNVNTSLCIRCHELLSVNTIGAGGFTIRPRSQSANLISSAAITRNRDLGSLST
jgi:hypothetical protein